MTHAVLQGPPVPVPERERAAPLVPRRGIVFAEGGGMGITTPWGYEGLYWMVQRAKDVCEGRPSFIVIGAVPVEVDERIGKLEEIGANAASMVVEPVVEDKSVAAAQLVAAHAVFIRGGDQSRYVKGWKGTPIEKALHTIFERGGVVGGTSAGCAILGELSYDANVGGLSPLDALADACHPDLTLTRGFLGLAPGILFDTHFSERGRIARLALMLAHARRDFGLDTLGVGVDAATAVAVDRDGVAHVMGTGVATLVRLPPADQTVQPALEPGKPPTVLGIRYSQLAPGTTFNAATGEVLTRPEGVTPNAHPEVVADTAFEALIIDGGRIEDATQGLRHAINVTRPSRDDDKPGPRPALTTGAGKVPAVIATGVWSKLSIWNALAQTQSALAQQPGLLAFWLDEGTRLAVDAAGVASVEGVGDAPRSLLALDSRGVTHAGVPNAADPHHPHLRVHLEGATLHVLAPGWAIDLNERAPRKAL